MCKGGGLSGCVGDHILQEFYTLYLSRFRTFKIVRPPRWAGGLIQIKHLRQNDDILHCLLESYCIFPPKTVNFFNTRYCVAGSPTSTRSCCPPCSSWHRSRRRRVEPRRRSSRRSTPGAGSHPPSTGPLRPESWVRISRYTTFHCV